MRAAAIPAWVSEWVGLPYAPRGRGPGAYDCWGLYRAVFAARTGVVLPGAEDTYPAGRLSAEDLAGIVARAAAGAAEAGEWRPVAERFGQTEPPAGQPALYDAVLMWRRGHLCHVGMVVAPGQVLHIDSAAHSLVERLAALGPSVQSIWRHCSQVRP